MELTNEIITAISTVGFPIIMCLLIYFTEKKNQSALIDEIKAGFAEIKDAIKELKER